MKEVSRLLRPMEESPAPLLIGYFNPQSLLFARTRDPAFDKACERVEWRYNDVPTNRTCLMIRTSFLRPDRFDLDQQAILRRWLAAGKLRALAATPGDPFPEVIEIGEPIPAGEDAELGRRILFALDWSHSAGFGERPLFLPEWSATRWLATTNPTTTTPVSMPAAYADSSFRCYTNDVGAGIIYSCRMPLVYHRRSTLDRIYTR